jgi:pyridoxamine 5'-phosphate oxidase
MSDYNHFMIEINQKNAHCKFRPGPRACDPRAANGGIFASLTARHPIYSGHRFMGLAEIRREYNLTGLRRRDLVPEPLAQFQRWFEDASNARVSGRLRKLLIRIYKSLLLAGGGETMDVNAMTLATTDKQGQPSARTVLLKGIDARGFIFYTNYDSHKGKELAENPHAALVFYWPDLERQVCVAGEVSRLPEAESDAYFRSRPRGARLAALASNQSEPVGDRGVLEQRWKQFEAKYPGEDVPRPVNWGGYVLAPKRVEFWQGRPNRLHDRFCYIREGQDGWRIERLSP